MRHRHALVSSTLALALGATGLVAPTAAFASSGRRHVVPRIGTTFNYPFAAANPAKADPWGAEVRQCTSYASWWLSSQGFKISPDGTIRGPRGSATLGNGAHWEAAARQAGYHVSRRPVVGAIAQWRSDESSTWHIPHGFSSEMAGSDGHVAVVRRVYADGTALIQDYNGGVALGLHEFRGKAPRYLLLHS